MGILDGWVGNSTSDNKVYLTGSIEMREGVLQSLKLGRYDNFVSIYFSFAELILTLGITLLIVLDKLGSENGPLDR